MKIVTEYLDVLLIDLSPVHLSLKRLRESSSIFSAGSKYAGDEFCFDFVRAEAKKLSMKVETPQIAWHNRDRVSSISIQPQPHPKPTKEGGTRIATAGDDTHVVVS